MVEKINIKKLIFSSALISSILSIFFGMGAEANPLLSIIFTIPLVYGFLYYYLIPNYIDYGPGWTILTLVLSLRYLVFTPIFALNGYKSSIVGYYDGFFILLTVSVIMIELFAILFTARVYFKYKYKRKQINCFKRKNNMPFSAFVVLISLLIISSTPAVLLNFHFVFDSSRFAELNLANEEFVYGTGMQLELVKYGIVFFNLFVFEKFCSKYIETLNLRYLILSIMPIVISSLFYIGISRSSLLLPFLTYLFLIVKFYRFQKEKIVPLLIAYISVLMITLTIFKQFRTESIKDGSNRLSQIEFLSNFLNDYTSSFPNIYKGLISGSKYENDINSETIMNDYIAALPVIHRFADMRNRTNIYFNIDFSDRSKESHRILPLNVQGFMHFGIFFFIYSILTVYLILRFDLLFHNATNVYSAYLFAFVGIAIGFSIGHTFTAHVIGRITKVFLPLLFLVFLNNNFNLKFRPSAS